MRRLLTVVLAIAMLVGQMAASFAALPHADIDAAASGAAVTTTTPSATPDDRSECPCCPEDTGAADCLATCLAMTSTVAAPRAESVAAGRTILSPTSSTLLISPADTPPTPPPIR